MAGSDAGRRTPDASAGNGRCSSVSASLGEQLPGSAPSAVGWVALEQNGPWGARAFTASHLDPVVGRALETAATLAGVRPCLIRRPGPHPDSAGPAASPRQVLVAHSLPGRTWLLGGLVDDPSALLEMDWDAVASGDVASAAASLSAFADVVSPSPVAHLLVCTNGTRDVCCAVTGRPVAALASVAHPGRVWETTHTSGHRFAPTAVLLPHGTLHGRLDGPGAARLLDAADRDETVLDGYRGRSTWPAPGQVAEHAVRSAVGEIGLDALRVRAAGDDWQVDHADGRSWRVDLERVADGAVRPESCGKTAVEMHRYDVRSITVL